MARQSRSAPPPPSSPSPQHPSKLPKFLQKQSRDRSRSLTDPATSDSTTSIASSSSSAHTSPPPPAVSPVHAAARKSRPGSRNAHDERPAADDDDSEHTDSVDEMPVIVETAESPRARTWHDRPFSAISDIRQSSSMYTPSSSTRMSDLPTRLSGWFSHTFSSSSTDLSLPTILSQSHMQSPKTKSNPLLSAAKHGKGHLDRAMRFLLDSDSTPDKCTDPIWLLGVQHPGYEPPPPLTPSRRPSVESRRTPSFRSNSSSSVTVSELSQSQPPGKNPAANWPPAFYADFTSRIWLTYRNQFAPIRDSNLSSLDADLASGIQVATPSSPRPKKWNWPGAGEKGWTSDAGWGCMLRTGQSLLANALLHLHLGREWRRPPHPVRTNDFAMYVQILTWFLDSPLPQAPFSVHRMALAGKDLGKDVGQWFGPSTAAGAIKTLVNAFPEAGLGVAIAADGVVYQSDVFAASNVHIGSPRRHARLSWGGQAVLVLIGIRLGIDGVNPIYYEPIKALYTFPQSVGIAGGRPSSSYYFMGSQADNLFYLDPHHARPTVPLRPAPPSSVYDYPTLRSRENTPDNTSDRRAATRSPGAHSTSSTHYRTPTSPSSVRTGSSTFSYHAPLSPSPLQHQLSSASSMSSSSVSSQHPIRWQNASMPSSSSLHFDGPEMDPRELGVEEEELEAVAEHYVAQYSAMELRTFHCDRVRKMPLSGLDPSMLLGFLCKEEKDWTDLRRRINELNAKHKTIFTIQDEPPSWPSDSDEFMGLESISDPDDMELDPDEEDSAEVVDEDGVGRPVRTCDGEDRFFETRSSSVSPVRSSVKGGTKGSEADTEEDPMGPVTPGPNSLCEVDKHEDSKDVSRNEDFEEIDGNIDYDDDDEWVDPSMPTPLAQSIERPYAPPLIAKAKSTGSTGSASSGRKGRKGKKTKKGSVPLVHAPSPATALKPETHFPFPRSLEESFHERWDETGKYEKRMNNARARDGGRTESGGIKAVLTDDVR